MEALAVIGNTYHTQLQGLGKLYTGPWTASQRFNQCYTITIHPRALLDECNEEQLASAKRIIQEFGLTVDEEIGDVSEYGSSNEQP